MRYKQEDATDDHIRDAIQTPVKSDRFEEGCRVKPSLETDLYWRKKKRIPSPFHLVCQSLLYCHFIVVAESLSHAWLWLHGPQASLSFTISQSLLKFMSIELVQGTLKSLLQDHDSKASILLFGAQPSLWSNSHICTWLLEKPQLWLYGSLLAKWCLCFLIHYLGLPQLSFQGASMS